MYSARTIREALREGTHAGSRLFAELWDEAVKERLKRDPHSARLAEDVLRMAREAAGRLPEPITFAVFMEYARSGKRERYDRLLTLRLNELAVLGMAAYLDESGEWIEAVQERIWELCNLYIWELTAVVPLEPNADGKPDADPRTTVGLLASETAFQLMELLSVLSPKLDPFLVARVKQEVTERVVRPFATRTFWWQTASTNWQSVCSCSIGSAAMYLIEDEEELSMLLGRVLTGLQSYLEGFDRDGATQEGLEYWTYGFASFVFFAELLHERTAGRLRLLEHPRVRAIAAFPLAMMLSGGSVVNFSDCAERTALPGYLAVRLEQRLGLAYGLPREQVTRLPQENMARWPYLSRTLLWTTAQDGLAPREPATGMTFFAESQWLVDKRLTEDGHLLAFAAKGGHNDEPHNHNDVGHFIVHVAGRNVMPDLGAPEYTGSTFTAERYSQLLPSSLGHSVPVVNGKPQAPGRDHGAEVIECRDDGRAVRFKLELGRAYDAPELESYVREWEWDYTACLLRIQDSFRFAEEGVEVEETFWFRDRPRLLPSGGVQVDAGICTLDLTYPEQAIVHIEEKTFRVRSGEEATAFCVRMSYRFSERIACFELQIRITINRTGGNGNERAPRT
jgi:hypothetical protein